MLCFTQNECLRMEMFLSRFEYRPKNSLYPDAKAYALTFSKMTKGAVSH